MPTLTDPLLSPEQLAHWSDKGYFVVRNVIDRDEAMEIRGVIRNHLLTPDLHANRDEIDPMDPMGDSPEARQARLRKLGDFCPTSPLIWHTVHGNDRVLRYARYFLGDNLLLKYNSCFLKPARTGSVTPWHQDNGLWRDGETEPFNFWLAIDPATRANGCMQFIPGSHKGDIVQHVVYEDSIHGELPRDHVKEMIEAHGVKHMELEPGDMVCWHSNLYHFSPCNTSEQGRIAVAGVYTNPTIAEKHPRIKRYRVCMENGEALPQFPPRLREFPGTPGPPPDPPPKVGPDGRTSDKWVGY